MKGILEYKGYYTQPIFIPEDEIIYGKLIGISDLITYQVENTKLVREEFEEAVNDYLQMCQEYGKIPEKPKFKNTNFKNTSSQIRLNNKYEIKLLESYQKIFKGKNKTFKKLLTL